MGCLHILFFNITKVLEANFFEFFKLIFVAIFDLVHNVEAIVHLP